MTKSFKERLCEIEDGRFADIVNVMDIKPVCEDCQAFDDSIPQGYRCAIAPNCIGATLHKHLKSYFLLRLGKKTHAEHMEYITKS